MATGAQGNVPLSALNGLNEEELWAVLKDEQDSGAEDADGGGTDGAHTEAAHAPTDTDHGIPAFDEFHDETVSNAGMTPKEQPGAKRKGVPAHVAASLKKLKNLRAEKQARVSRRANSNAATAKRKRKSRVTTSGEIDKPFIRSRTGQRGQNAAIPDDTPRGGKGKAHILQPQNESGV